jgi:hypothetical protein
MTAGTWHVSPTLIDRYQRGAVDSAAAASIETHLTSCDVCRADVARLVPLPDLSSLWDGVRQQIAQPQEPWLVRQLRRVGLADADAVILSASQSLRVPWALAVMAAVISTIVLAMVSDRRADLLYVLLAPLVPALGVAATYDSTDPIREVAEATPYSKFRLLLLRTLVVAVCSIPPILALGFVLTGVSPVTFAWLLPSILLTTAALVLLRWWSAWRASIAVVAAWAAVVALAGRQDPVGRLADLPVQVAFAVLSLATLAVLVHGFAPWSRKRDAS